MTNVDKDDDGDDVAVRCCCGGATVGGVGWGWGGVTERKASEQFQFRIQSPKQVKSAAAFFSIFLSFYSR